MTRPPPATRLFTRPFVMLSLAELGYFTADGLAIFALPLYVTGPVGSGQAGAGLAFGAFALTALALRPIAGRLADTAGRRPLMVIGAGLTVPAMFFTAHVDTLTAVVGLRVLFGVGEAAFFVAAFAALADLAPSDRMGEALSYNSLSLYLGLVLGPLIGNTVANELSIEAAWYAAAALALLAVGAVAGVGETLVASKTTTAGPRSGLIHWPAVPVGLGFLAAVVAMAAFLAFAALRARELDMSNASLPLVAYGATVVLCRLAFAKAMDRVPSLPLAASSLVATASGLAIAAVWHAPAGLLVGAVVIGVGVAFSTPAFFAAMFETAGPRQRGAASATASILLDVGLGIGPLLLGALAEAFDIPWMFGVAAGLTLLGAAWVFRLTRRPT